MKRFGFRRLFHLSFVIILLCTVFPLAVRGFDFGAVRQKVEKALEEGKGEIEFGKLGDFKGYLLERLKMSGAQAVLSPKDANLLIITGKGGLPSEFQGLQGKTVEMVVTITPTPATVREKNDLICTLTGFFDSLNLADWYKGQKCELFDLLKLETSLVAWSSAKMNLAADVLPADAKGKFAAVLGDAFVLSLENGATVFTLIQTERVEPFKGLARLVQGLDPDLRLHWFLCLNPADIKGQIDLPKLALPFLPGGGGGIAPFLFLNAKPVAFGVGAEASLKLPPHDDLAKGVVRLTMPVFEATDPKKVPCASLLGNLQGTWKDAFGLGGLTLYDLALKGEVPITGSGMALGLAGKADLGMTRLELAGKIPIGGAPIPGAMMAQTNHLPFGDLVAFLAAGGNPKAKPEIPVDRLALRDVRVSVAATDDRDLNIKAGISLQGTLLFGKEELGLIDLRTTHEKQSALSQKITGFSGKGWVKKFKLGPLSVDGKGLDGKAGTSDDGPFIDLACASISPDSLTLSALIKLFKVEKEAQVKVSGLSIECFLRERVFDLYEGEFTLIGKPDPAKPEFLVKVALTKTFADDLVKAATGAFADAAEAVTEEVEDAREALAAAVEEVEDARQEASQDIEAFKKKMEKFKERLEKQEKKVDRLDKKIEKTKKQFKNCKWNQIKKKARLGTRIATLGTAHGVAKSALVTLRKVLDEKNLDKAADAAKKAADETLKVAENALEGVKAKVAEAEKELGEVTAFSQNAKDLGQHLTIEEAGFEMSLEDLQKAKTPKLYARLNLYGKKVEANLQFDFTKQEEAFLKLTEEIFTQFAKQDEKLGKAAILLLKTL